MPIQAIESKRLYQQVADQIASLVVSGEWQVGERLPAERELAKLLNVSRPTVREAMIALELMGLVEVRTGAGIYVTGRSADTPVSLQDSPSDPGPGPFELLAARRLIEGETAASAAKEISPQGLDGLMDAIEKMELDIDKGIQAVTDKNDGDLLFHSRIAAATGNSVMVSIVDQLWEGMRRPMFTTICERVWLPGNARRAVKDHRIIYARIADGDHRGARRAMREHLDQVMSWLMKEESAG